MVTCVLTHDMRVTCFENQERHTARISSEARLLS